MHFVALLLHSCAFCRATSALVRIYRPIGPFKCYVTQMRWEGVKFSGKKRYEGVSFNVISVTRGWVVVQFLRKKSVM